MDEIPEDIRKTAADMAIQMFLESPGHNKKIIAAAITAERVSARAE